MSDEQIKQKVGAVIEEWWKYCRPAKLLNEQHNVSEIFEAVYNDAKIRGGNIDVADVTRVVCGLGDIDHDGKLIYHKAPVVQAASQGNNIIPWADEPLLRTVVSMEAVRQMTKTQLKMVASLYPYNTKGETIVPIGKKFEERLGWLKANPDVDPSAVADAINRVLGDNKPQSQTVVVRRRPEDPRIQALRARIDQELKGYTNWTIKKRERLNTTLDEILRDPSRQIYRDRSRGGIEIIRGLAAIEHLVADAINDAVNGSVQ